MSSRSAWFFASVHSLLRPLLTGPPPIGNIGGGVYWKPIWNVLEGEVELLLCNAQHIKAVPGRKTERAGRCMDRRPAPAWEARGEFCASPSEAGNCGT